MEPGGPETRAGKGNSPARRPSGTGVGPLDRPPGDLQSTRVWGFFDLCFSRCSRNSFGPYLKRVPVSPDFFLNGRPEAPNSGQSRVLAGPFQRAHPRAPGTPGPGETGPDRTARGSEGKVPGARGGGVREVPGGPPGRPKGRAAGTSPSRDTGRFVQKSLARNRAYLGSGRSQRLGAAGAAGAPRGPYFSRRPEPRGPSGPEIRPLPVQL